MVDIEETYQKLTGVNIETQKTLWNERGKGYYGEYLVFKDLYPSLSGNCKILMNLELPCDNGKTTEIDLLLIHETGLYIFEMKHYKGTIYGKTHEKTWTQYFRTAPNSKFYNPILQNQLHINAIKNLFREIPTYSFIVFTNEECDLRVECDDELSSVCTLSELHILLRDLEIRDKVLDIEQINNIFNKIMVFSPLKQRSVEINETEVPFFEYLDTIIKEYKDNKTKIQDQYYLKEQELNHKKNKVITMAFVVSLLCVVVFIFSSIQSYIMVDKKVAEIEAVASSKIDEVIADAERKINAAETELEQFAQKFEHIKPYNNGNVYIAEGFITVEDVVLISSPDFKNTSNLSFKIVWNGEQCNAKITRNSAINVILKNGTVKEYNLTEKTFPYKTSDLNIGKGNSWVSAREKYTFPIQELYGVDVDEISYIKLSNIDIWVTGNGSYNPVIVATGYEFCIYKA